MAVNETQEAWPKPRYQPELQGEELETWETLTAQVRELAQGYGWSKAEVSRKSGVPSGTFSQWYDGNYKGTTRNVNERIKQWLESLHQLSEAAALMPDVPGFIRTPTADEICDTLTFAQMMPDIAVIVTGAGMGKTMTATYFRESRPHAYLVTMRPTTSTVHGMLLEFCQALDINEKNPARMDRAIGDKLRRNGRQTLLMVDEAQNLKDEAVNQLRYFFDNYDVGIALLGNEALYGRFSTVKSDPAFAQIHRRIGKRFKRLRPTSGDVDAIVEAWNLEDQAAAELARAIGRKPGALAQITKTLQVAGMLAAGEGRKVNQADVKRAWIERGGEV